MSSITPSSSASNVVGSESAVDITELSMPQPGQSPEYYRACEVYYRALIGRQVDAVSVASSTSGASKRRRARKRRSKDILLSTGFETVESVSTTLSLKVVDPLVLIKPQYRECFKVVFGRSLSFKVLASLPVKVFQDDWALWSVSCVFERDKVYSVSTQGTSLFDVLISFRLKGFGGTEGTLISSISDSILDISSVELDVDFDAKLMFTDLDFGFGDGYCYAQLLPDNYKAFAFDIGSWPYLDTLLHLALENSFSLNSSNVSVYRVGIDKLHVCYDLFDGSDLTTQFVRFVNNFSSSNKFDSGLSRLRIGGKGASRVTFGRKLPLHVVQSSSQNVVADHINSFQQVTSVAHPLDNISLSYYNDALVTLAGKIGDKLDTDRLVLLSKSAALLSSADKNSMKMLEAMGDASLTLVIASKCSQFGKTPEEYQAIRTALTSNSTLSKVYVQSGLDRYVAFVSGVSPGQGKVGASMLEAVLGTIFEVYGYSSVALACEVLELFDDKFD